MNLLTETQGDIKRSGHAIGEISFIGSRDGLHQCTWEEFELMANREYDEGYGGQEVASDLIIFFSDGSFLWRSEYDGSESWGYSKPIRKKKNPHSIRSLFVGEGFEDTLKEINKGKK